MGGGTGRLAGASVGVFVGEVMTVRFWGDVEWKKQHQLGCVREGGKSMAQRKSAAMLGARERARKAASESMAREERLLELGEKFFISQGTVEDITETAEKKIAEIHAKVEKDVEAARADQASVVAAMKADKVSVTEIGQRLELAPAEVRALLKLTGADSESADNAGSGEVEGSGDEKPSAIQENAGVPAELARVS